MYTWLFSLTYNELWCYNMFTRSLLQYAKPTHKMQLAYCSGQVKLKGRNFSKNIRLMPCDLNCNDVIFWKLSFPPSYGEQHFNLEKSNGKTFFSWLIKM